MLHKDLKWCYTDVNHHLNFTHQIIVLCLFNLFVTS